MIGPIQKLHAVLSKPLIPPVFFFGGVTFDSLTLTRIDHLLNNLLLLLYVSLLGALIVLTGRVEMGHTCGPRAPASTTRWTLPRLLRWAEPYYLPGLQFLFGALFSAYAFFTPRAPRGTPQPSFS